MNIFEYAYQNEVMFEKQCAEIGYKRQTTFYSDLSIAEAYGIKEYMIGRFKLEDIF